MALKIASEESPLLQQQHGTNNDEVSPSASPAAPIYVLGELIGARHLNFFGGNIEKRVELYCVVQFGPRFLHRTTPLTKSTKVIATSLQYPIWTIKESPLFIIPVKPNDMSNRKTLVVTLWARQKVKRGSIRKSQVEFCGKIRLKVAKVLEFCTEERMELNLVDEMGRSLQGSNDSSPTLALRFRVASEADLRFVTGWNRATESRDTWIPRTVLNGTGVLSQEHRTRADLVTELEESSVPGAKLRTAISSSVVSAGPRNKVRVKPFPDPNKSSTTMFMSRSDLKDVTKLPSMQWVDAGSGTLGRLHLEILSCHNLPNVDIGTAVGNQTDSFVAAVYGDAMVQTCVIDDELSPKWPPWTQRAFVLHMMHPSQALYLAVFGYKRGLLTHTPIGRVEILPINLQRDTVYDLQYSLSQSSHTMNTKACGSIRIRLRLEINDERAALLAALKPYPELHVNVRKKKSLRVARYACCGEYDNEDKFSLRVLLAYVDELKDKYPRRLLYSVNDGVQSLIFWRGQVKVGPWWLPIHSMLVFCTGILILERPQLIPSVMCIGVAWIMLVNMQFRKQSPSLWYRCFSFWHFLRILLLGKSSLDFEKVSPGENWEEQNAIEDASKLRMEEDDRFMEMKEAAEKDIEEVEDVSIDTKSKAAFIPIEVLVVLGKLQGLVGNICRLCRLVDAVITWEASNFSFWLTAAFLTIGIIFLFVPWGFLLKWTGRIAVVLLVGPQNKLFDVLLEDNSKDKQKLRKLLAERWARARCRQEEAGKLKAFRHVLFGKFSTAVPTSMWTPHQDRPLPQSEAHVVDISSNANIENIEDLPYIPGQKLYGLMIPRPKVDWFESCEQSKQGNKDAKAALRGVEQSIQAPTSCLLDSPYDEVGVDEGVEITDEFDEEATFVTNVANTPIAMPKKVLDHNMLGDRGVQVHKTMNENVKDSKFVGKNASNILPRKVREDSMRGDWGIEIAETFDDEAIFAEHNWQGSVHDFPEVGISSDSDDDGFNEQLQQETAIAAAKKVRKDSMQGDRGVEVSAAMHELDTEEATFVKYAPLELPQKVREDSMRGDWGIEIAETFDDEATFVEQNW